MSCEDVGPTCEQVDERGMTTLMLAAEQDRVDVAQLLLEAGANKDRRSHANRTAMMYAARNGCTFVVRLLHSTALMGAADEGHPSVRLLLEAGANTELLDIRGKTALSDGN